MWRHEDIWRTLAGGIDFLTGEPLADEWAQSRKGAEGTSLVRMAPAPLIHGAAMVATLGCLFAGDAAVILPKFDPDALWAAVERHRVNTLSVIGDAMARPLMEALAAGNYDTSSLINLNSTAALFSPAVRDAVAKALPSVFLTEAIGSTETGFTGMALHSAGAEHRGGPTVTAGPEVIVIDEAGRACGPGETGKLARGGHIPLGYYKDPVKTAEMFTEVDGRRYAVPGDWARVEADGTITLLGRGNTCVNTGGEKVYPEEVEGALKSHPDVFDSLVLGVPDDRLGQRVAALIQLRPGAPTDAAALQAHVHGQLAGYKVPRTVWFVDAIGRTVSGKADYSWARAYAAEHPPATPSPAERAP
jgi:acyl-coenzyme A synthetase/AMP-(fatty) acid ligase